MSAKPWRLRILRTGHNEEFIGVAAIRGRDELFAPSFSELEEKIREFISSNRLTSSA